MRAPLALLGLATALGLAPFAEAQSVVGRTIVNGQEVELLSDRTWRETAPQAAGCRTVEGAVLFCGSPAMWQPNPPANSQISAFYVVDERRFAQIIHEATGRAVGLDERTLRQLALMVAANANDLHPDALPVLDVLAAEIDGLPAETIVYRVDLGGLRSVFANTLLLGDDFVVQAMTWELADGYSIPHRALHARFLAEIRVEPAP